MKRPLCVVCLIFFFVMLGLLKLADLPVFVYEDGQKLSLEAAVSEVSKTEYGQVIRLTDVSVIWADQNQNSNQEANLNSNQETINRQNKSNKQSVFSNQIHLQPNTNLYMDVIAYLGEAEVVRTGQRVRITGVFQALKGATNPGQFDQRLYQTSQNVAFYLKKAKVTDVSIQRNAFVETLAHIRERMAEVFVRDAVHAELFKTMILGLKRELSQDIKSLYQKSGISHLLAISALHLSIIGMSVYRLLKKLGVPLFLSTILSVSLLVCFGQMTGSSISTIRALIMFTISVFAMQIGRTYDLLSALAFSFMVMIVYRPRVMQNTGFALSFSAVLGIGIVLPYLQNRFGKGKIRNMLYAPVSVNLFTLPVLLSSYYSFSTYSIIINLIVVPFMGIVLILGIIGGIVGCFCQSASYFFIIPDWILFYYEKVCLFAQRLPGGTIVFGKPGTWQIVLYYGVLLLVVYGDKIVDRLHQWRPIDEFAKRNHTADRREKKVDGQKRKTKQQKRMELAIEAGKCLLACLTLLLILYLPGQIAGRTSCRLTMLDIGQGDCMCLQVYGTTILIDGGSSSQKDIARYQIEPFLKSQGIAKIDYIMLSHPDEDHINGIMELLASEQTDLSFGTLLVTEQTYEMWREESQAQSVFEIAQNVGCDLNVMKQGDLLKLPKNCEIRCLFPRKGETVSDTNDDSMVLLFSGAHQRVLFTGDLSKEREQQLLQNETVRELISNVDVLKVSHHGSSSGSSTQFLQIVKPKVALISCGEGNRYGHPHGETLERLKDAGAKVLRTDEAGAIEVLFRDEKVALSEYGAGRSKTRK